MQETPHRQQDRTSKLPLHEQPKNFASDTIWMRKIEELFQRNNGNDISWKMNGHDYKYIFVTTPNGWSISEERREEDGSTNYLTINMRNGKYELFRNTVKSGKEYPIKTALSIEAAREYIRDFTNKITIIHAGRQTSSLDDTLAFA